MDWGIARPIGPRGASQDQGLAPTDHANAAGQTSDANHATDAGRTRIGDAIGTPPYMSPEQIVGNNDLLDARSDQYAMGLILHECVALRPAVSGASVEAILAKQMLGIRDPTPIGTRPGAIPARSPTAGAGRSSPR
jgi:serine/threonine protein kinase